MDKPTSPASKQRTVTIGIPLAAPVILGTLLAVVMLSLGDLMEIIPLFAPLVATPAYPFFHEVHDLLAVGVVLYAAYKYHVRLGVAAILLYLVAHIPYIMVSFREESPEILRILLGGFVALLGIWLIKQLQKSREQWKASQETARKERRFSQNIIATVPEALLVVDKNLRIKSANRSFYQLFQTNSENTIGRNLPSMLGEEAGTFSAELNRLFGTDDTLENFELQYQSGKLGERVFNITARGIIVAEEEEEEEEEEEQLVVIRDITERKQAEEALQEAEARYRALVRLGGQIGEAIIMLQDEGEREAVHVFCNDVWPRITGYSEGELLNMSFFELVHPKDREASLRRHRRKVRRESIPGLFEVTIVRKDGSEVSIELTSAWSTYQGKPTNVAYIRDITERKQAEEALRESEERLKATVMNAPIGIATSGADRYFLSANGAFCRILGYTEAELQRMSFKDITHPEDLEKSIANMADLDAGKVAFFSLEKRYIRKDGKVIIGKVMVSAVRDKDGGPYLYIAELEDITESKRAEEERLELERKAQRASRLASIGEMAAGIAHEINNPLTPILGFTEILMKRELPEDAKSDLKIIYDSTRRTADVTRRLLTFARQKKPMRVLCQINEVVESTLQLRGYHLKTNNIKVISELDTGLPQTTADASQLQQVLLNLIMNAEYEMTQSHGGGNLLVKTERTGNSIRVSVKDDGPGISRENMEKLFTPFFTTKKVGEGTGLGLSVCHGIVAEHNGRIYAESKVGKGATFVVELPIVRQQGKKETKPSESDTVEAGEAVKAKILVVDDEPTIVQILKRVLTDEGYEVRATSKAKEALRLIESGKYACILLDIKLPDMSGIELYQHLDKTAKPSAQKIIFITGDVMGADTMDFFSRTGAACITKPFEIEQLKKEVKSKLTPGR